MTDDGAPHPTLRHRIEYLLYRSVAALVSALPEGLAFGVGTGLGWFAGEVVRIRRGVVARHLALAFPDASPERRRAIASACYRHFGREMVAFLRLSHLSTGEIAARTEVEGIEALREALARGRGAILVTGHLGNWELAAAALAARGVPIEAVVFRQANPLFDRALVLTRARLGITIVRKGDAPRRLPEVLRAGGVVGLAADQDARGRGIFVDFFGRPASTAKGPARLSLSLGAPIFAGAALADPDEPGRYRVVMQEVSVSEATRGPGGDGSSVAPEEQVRALTQAHVDLLRRQIEAAPEQYFWFHRRWKTRPPDAGGNEGGRGTV